MQLVRLNDVQLAGHAGWQSTEAATLTDLLPYTDVCALLIFCSALFALFSPWLPSQNASQHSEWKAPRLLWNVNILCDSSRQRLPCLCGGAEPPSRPSAVQRFCWHAATLRRRTLTRETAFERGEKKLQQGAAVLWRLHRRVCRIFLSRLPANWSVDQTPKSDCPLPVLTSASFGSRASGCQPRFYRSARFLSAEDARDKGWRGFCLAGGSVRRNPAGQHRRFLAHFSWSEPQRLTGLTRHRVLVKPEGSRATPVLITHNRLTRFVSLSKAWLRGFIGSNVTSHTIEAFWFLCESASLESHSNSAPNLQVLSPPSAPILACSKALNSACLEKLRWNFYWDMRTKPQCSSSSSVKTQSRSDHEGNQPTVWPFGCRPAFFLS